MLNKELSAEKLDNWIRQIEVYYKIQKLAGNEAQIQLDSLQLGGMNLIQQEKKNQEDLITKGKLFPQGMGLFQR